MLYSDMQGSIIANNKRLTCYLHGLGNLFLPEGVVRGGAAVQGAQAVETVRADTGTEH